MGGVIPGGNWSTSFEDDEDLRPAKPHPFPKAVIGILGRIEDWDGDVVLRGIGWAPHSFLEPHLGYEFNGDSTPTPRRATRGASSNQ